ncbi:MAG TPA: threonine synthase [Steroidobacteraceae bacterium]|jgi:threonine synthase|nr:threonine synthase [Steroidobacteraceae bacterium]
MRFTSTRDAALAVGFSDALVQGIAPDGGLYVPTSFPKLTADSFGYEGSLPGVAQKLIGPFAEGDKLEAQLGEIAREAFDFPAPLVPISPDGRLAVLELFHGPTAAFKDFGARFLAACMARARSSADRPLKILVATSGDTGGAVAAAFHNRPRISVSVLFPKGLVSPTQERQLTCWGGNVHTFAVRGSFDDCQRMVKEAFADPELRKRMELSSANSINLGRLLPQAVYYAATSLAVWREYRERASFIVPSGNLGNVVACIWAKKIGLPIADVVLAHNVNRSVPDYFDTGAWRPRASVPTLASAMDVGNPSNMERLRSLIPEVSELRSFASAHSVTDEEIRARIRTDFDRYGRIWCPHTAVAAEVYERLSTEQRRKGRWILVATAHPAKFREIVEPLIGRTVPVPEALARLFARPTECSEIAADLGALRSAL